MKKSEKSTVKKQTAKRNEFGELASPSAEERAEKQVSRFSMEEAAIVNKPFAKAIFQALHTVQAVASSPWLSALVPWVCVDYVIIA